MAPDASVARETHAVSLIVLHPSGSRTRVAVQPLPFLIGRQSDNHLVLRDNRVSRSHARLLSENGEYFVEDLNSRHGVYVNGLQVNRQKLHNSDRIEFGSADSYQLLFVVDEEELRRLLEQFSIAGKDSQPTGSLGKLRALVEVARALQTSLSTDEILGAVIDAALAVTGSERGFLLLPDGEDLSVRVARNRQGAPLQRSDLRVPTRLIDRALKQRSEMLTMNFDPYEATGPRPEHTVADLELKSVVAVPLIRVRTGEVQETAILSSLSETIGLLYMDSRRGEADLSSGNRELLQTLALEASTILENARLLEEERAKQRLEEELNIARQIQTSLLPPSLPSQGWFRAAGSSIPSHHVGGDYFDLGLINPSCWFTVTTDVSGKGVSSALLASLLQGVFLTASQGLAPMEEMMMRVNRFLIERTQGEKYATIFYCTVCQNGLFHWVNAGHCPALLLRKDGTLQTLGARGLPVGMLEEATYKAEEEHLAPGDKVVVYTDGLSEARNENGEFFGASTIGKIVLANRAASCSELHETLVEAVESFVGSSVQQDDITVLVFEYRLP